MKASNVNGDFAAAASTTPAPSCSSTKNASRSPRPRTSTLRPPRTKLSSPGSSGNSARTRPSPSTLSTTTYASCAVRTWTRTRSPCASEPLGSIHTWTGGSSARIGEGVVNERATTSGISMGRSFFYYYNPAGPREGSPAVRLAGIGHEQALPEAPPAERADQSLGLRRHEEVGQGPAARGVDPWGVLRVDLHDVVNVKKEGIALDHGNQLQLVPPRQIGRPVGERVGPLLVRHLQRRRHSLPRLHVPGGGARRRRGEAGATLQHLLPHVRPRLIAARNERPV